MWRSSQLIGYGIRAQDGAIGTISDLLFDDAGWTLRWAVVDTGTWLPGRQVLLPPSALGNPDEVNREFPVDLTRGHIESSPGLKTDAPVSRQLETKIYSYYDWTPYWAPGYAYPIGAPAAGGMTAAPVPTPRAASEQEPEENEPSGDPHLRSVNEVTGYYVEASDGNIGHVEDFMVEREGWVVRYLMVDTKNWRPGKIVLISPRWLTEISWGNRQVFLEVDREKVKNSPEYDPAGTLDPAYEERLHGHYGYLTYWGGADRV